MEVEDGDVFEITDFTLASEWESFISSLEEVINEWRLPNIQYSKPLNKGDLGKCTFKETTESIKFSNVTFTVTHHYVDVNEEEEATTMEVVSNDESEMKDWPFTYHDLLSTDNDFPAKSHCLTRWYGLRDFLVISPTGKKPIEGESRIKLLLSSAAIAISNTACLVPIFVQVVNPERQLYLGVSDANGLRVDFEMANMKKMPTHYRHLGGLVEMFLGKINCPTTSFPKVDVSARWTYCISGWPDSFVENLVLSPTGSRIRHLTGFALGVDDVDPVKEIYISTTWPKVPQYALNDTAAVNRLSPLEAPQWGLRLAFIEKPSCMMAGTLRHFLKLSRRKESSNQLLSPELLEEDSETDPQAEKAFQRLTDSKASSYSLRGFGRAMVRQATQRFRTRRENAPIDDATLSALLLFLFPDALDDKSDDREPTGSEHTTASPLNPKKKEMGEILSRQLKAAPIDSVTHRLAVAIATVNEHLGIHGVAHLWHEFVLELRFRWDNSILLPEVEEEVSHPDLGACLLQQKVEMLQYCVDKRLARERRQRESAKERSRRAEKNTSEETDETDETEDEFFECQESLAGSDLEESGDPLLMDTDEASTSMEEGKPGASSLDDSPDRPPEGRLKPFEGMHLLNYHERPIYVPVTQTAAALTEDGVEEQTEMMTKLGTSAQGAALRARMQTASLISDMSAFKAANPGCCMEDFVRWYSPRDFIEEEVCEIGEVEEKEVEEVTKVKGCLSQRMQVAGNIWVEAWHNAKPVPARLQKRLFDDTKEAQKVLHYLSSLKPGEVAQHLLPCVFLEALVTLHQVDEPSLPEFSTTLNGLCEQTARVSREQVLPRPGSSPSHASPSRRASEPAFLTPYEELLRRLGRAEFALSCARSMRRKMEIGAEKAEVSEDVWRTSVLPVLVQLMSGAPEVNIEDASSGPVALCLRHLLNQTWSEQAIKKTGEQSDERVKSEGGSPSHRRSSAQETSSTRVHFPEPAGQEFILRTRAPRPAPYSREGPQRMFCVIRKDHFHFAGAFAIDTTFT